MTQEVSTKPSLKITLKGLLASAVIMMVFFLIQTIIAALLVDYETARVGFDPADGSATGFMISASIFISAPMCIWLVFIALHTPSFEHIKPYISFKWPGATSAGLWLGAYLIFQFSAAGIFHLIGKPPQESITYAASTMLAFPLFLLASSLLAPLFEEIMFRGFLFGHLDRTLGALRASILSSILWAMVHFQYSPVEKGYIFLLGLLLCAARLRSRTLVTPILLHSFNNAITVMVISSMGM